MKSKSWGTGVSPQEKYLVVKYVDYRTNSKGTDRGTKNIVKKEPWYLREDGMTWTPIKALAYKWYGDKALAFARNKAGMAVHKA